MKNHPKICEIVFSIPVDKSFDYLVPEDIRHDISAGVRVKVEFAGRKKVGAVIKVKNSSDFDEKELKSVQTLLDTAPVFDDTTIKLAQWISDYYGCSFGEALFSCGVPSLKKGRKVKPLKEQSQVNMDEDVFDVSAAAESSKEIFKALDKALADKKTFLLKGSHLKDRVEAYLYMINRFISKGQSVLFLVPEIDFAFEYKRIFDKYFGDRIMLFYSTLTDKEQLQVWTRMKYGDGPFLVIGTRSAVFAPVQGCGAVIIEDESDPSYKQEDTPRYNAREVAARRAELLEDACLILGSASPTVETFYHTSEGRYGLVDLDVILKGRFIPKTETVDMKEEYIRGRKKIFSRRLENAINDTLSRSEKVILFTSRRGFSTYVSCPSCKFVLKCDRCSANLTYHYDESMLVCHRCNKKMKMPDFCPGCKSDYIRFAGIGSEKIESEAARIFPQASIARLDTDVIKNGVSVSSIAEDFKSGKINMLIGTQLLAKDIRIGGADLIGVISADFHLNAPNFRASEETFRLLHELSHKLNYHPQARIVFQTYAPENFVIESAFAHDYNGFYDKEIQLREMVKYPPFVHIIRFQIRAMAEDEAKKNAFHLSNSIKKHINDVEVLGPFRSSPYRLRGYYRYSILVKTKKVEEFVREMKQRDKLKRSNRKLIVTIDVDALQ